MTTTTINASDFDTLATYETVQLTMAKLTDGMVLADEFGMPVASVIGRTRGRVQTQDIDSYRTADTRILNPNTPVSIVKGIRLA